jgi:hypothetical protein
MKKIATEITGNPIPFVVGCLAGFYLSRKLDKKSDVKTILFTLAGGLTAATVYIKFTEKDNSLQITK